MAKDEYLFMQNEKCIILNFKWKDKSEKNNKADGKSHYLQFIIIVEYNRGGSETNYVIEYNTEINLLKELDNLIIHYYYLNYHYFEIVVS